MERNNAANVYRNYCMLLEKLQQNEDRMSPNAWDMAKVTLAATAAAVEAALDPASTTWKPPSTPMVDRFGKPLPVTVPPEVMRMMQLGDLHLKSSEVLQIVARML